MRRFNHEKRIDDETGGTVNTLQELSEAFAKARSYGDVDAMLSIAEGLDALEGTTARYTRLHVLGNVAMRTGDLDQALALYDEALRAFTETGNQYAIVSILSDKGHLHGQRNELALALESYQQCLHHQALADREGDQAGILHNIAMVYHLTGHYPQAVEHLERALEISTRRGLQQFIANHFAALGAVYQEWGDQEEALRYAEKARDAHEEIEDRVNAASDKSLIASILKGMGRRDEAVAMKQEVLDELLELQSNHNAIHNIVWLARDSVDVGLPEQAEQLLERHAELLRKFPKITPNVAIVTAEIHRQRGEFAAATRELEQALQATQESGQINWSAKICLALRDLAQETNELAAYIQYNDLHTTYTNEVRGQEATRKMAILEKEREMAAERQERERERAVLYSTLPQHIADRVIRGETIDDHFDTASVLFADVTGFTTHTASMPPREVITFLEELYNTFDSICKEHGVTKVKTIGDSYLCFGENAKEVAAAGLRMNAIGHTWPDGSPLQLRIGIHSGPVSAGVIGTERLQYDIWGDAVNTASRMESTGEPGRIQTSEAFAELVADRYTLSARGEIDIKGKGTMTTYWLEE